MMKEEKETDGRLGLTADRAGGPSDLGPSGSSRDARASLTQQWRPIETAPKDKRLLLWDAKREVAVSGLWHIQPTIDTPNGFDPGWEGWAADDDVIIWDDDAPTHWMPLPRPPRVSDENRDGRDAEQLGSEGLPARPDAGGGRP